MNDEAMHIIETKKNKKCVFMKESLYLSMTFWKKSNTNEAHTNEEYTATVDK